jgi:DNA-binding Lrp family transcriptional regulator
MRRNMSEGFIILTTYRTNSTGTCCMTDITDATGSATKWGVSAGRSQKVWAVYELLIHHNLIASRIADSLGLNRSTVSRHIKRLEEEQYIVDSPRLVDHQKRISATSKRSVSGYSKAYIRGPRATEADLLLAEAKSQVGVRAGSRPSPAQTNALPGGNTAMVDIHRIDFNLPADQNANRKGLPRFERSTEAWAELGVTPGNMTRGWAHWKCPPVETSIGEWNVYLRRRGEKNEEGEIKWGDFCLPNPVRITLPNRFWVTVKEAMDQDKLNSRITEAIWEVRTAVMKRYGFVLGFPQSKTSQMYEAGALRYDPALVARIKAERTNSGKGMLEVTDGITADGSHDLLKDGFAHLDCETPRQAAMQADPITALDHLLKESMDSMAQMRKVADETVVTIEEQAVKSSDSIVNQFEHHMANLTERMMNTFEERFTEYMRIFMEAQTQRAAQILQRFEDNLANVEPMNPESQMLLTDFLNGEEPVER